MSRGIIVIYEIEPPNLRKEKSVENSRKILGFTLATVEVTKEVKRQFHIYKSKNLISSHVTYCSLLHKNVEE